MSEHSHGPQGPLESDLMAEIERGLAAMGSVIPNFSPRPQQTEMIEEVARVFSGSVDERIAVIEAGTGSGKSLGYAIPGIAVAAHRALKLVIAPSTVSLQEQLLLRDLPAIAKATGWSFSAAIAKGRDRYACPLRLERIAGSNPLYADLLDRLTAGRWNGERDSLSSDDTDGWSLATAGRHECLGSVCPKKADCPLMLARARARKADVVVTNQDLLVTDARAGGGAMLPAPDKSLLVVDEAHSLPEKARKSGGGFGVELVAERLHGLQRGLFSALVRWHWTTGWTDVRDLRRLAAALRKLSLRLRGSEWRGETSWRWRFEQGRVDPRIRQDAVDVLDAARALSRRLSQRRERLLAEVDERRMDAHAAQELAARIAETARLAEQSSSALSLFCAQDPPRYPPAARWMDRREQSDGSRHKLCAAACSSAPMLSDGLWDQTAGAVLASATITALGTFERYLEAAGLVGRARTLKLSYVFDYQAQGTLNVEAMRHTPDQDGHSEEVAQRLREYVRPGEGTLALFTSRKAMETVAACLQDLGESLLVQDWLSKADILARHAENLRDGKPSVILGLQSFSEGVDLPGDLCTTVAIARLPFSVPTHPVDVTYSEWLRSQGRDPFREVAMPAAAIRLLQAVGRLIRKESDTGHVVILDTRAKSKRYGRELVDNLPPFRRGRPQRESAAA